MPQEPSNISREQQLEYINTLKNQIKDHEVVQKMFKEYGLSLDEIDLIPMAFADLDVSARTDHGIIYLSYKLFEDHPDPQIGDDHYLVHELTHVLQQTTGDKPTKGSADGDYLENEFEIESFNNQTEYIADEYSPKDAKEYVARVLNKHKVSDPKERKEKAETLLNIAKLRLARKMNGLRNT